MGQQPRISIVTATYNAVDHLPELIKSLSRQTDRDFEWVVADGASTDGTVAVLQAASHLNMVISSQPDFGIYDALNRAIRLASGEYYIVAGADDCFDADAIRTFRRAIQRSRADIVAARVRYGDKVLKVRRGPVSVFGGGALIAAHTLGTAFRKGLHASYGFYSRLYPIAADQFFVLQACASGATRHVEDFVAGTVGRSGVSSTDRIGNATEIFRVQVVTGRSVFVQAILFLLRLLRAR